jgi:zinc D-Ala-D-Ala carboxypeptidase
VSWKRDTSVMVVTLGLALSACAADVVTRAAVPRLGSAGPSDTGTDDGSIPENGSVSPFDTSHATIRNLDPALLQAVQQAATDARAKKIEMKVTSGWRSRRYQQQLLDQGVAKYGSVAKAREFISTPDTSAHVTGKAIDIGPTDAADWMIRRGSDYGLCQVYSNEMWHFELLTTPGGDCPQPRRNAAG